MSRTSLILWLATIALDAGGQLSFKAAALEPPDGSGASRWKYMTLRPWLWAGLACYVVQFLLWIAFLSGVPLSVAVLLASINIVVVAIAGRLLFHELLTPLRMAGVLLIALGVATVGYG